MLVIKQEQCSHWTTCWSLMWNFVWLYECVWHIMCSNWFKYVVFTTVWKASRKGTGIWTQWHTH